MPLRFELRSEGRRHRHRRRRMRGPRRASRTRAAGRDHHPRMRSLRDRHSRSAITSRHPHRDECRHDRKSSQERREGEDAAPGVDPESRLSDRAAAPPRERRLRGLAPCRDGAPDRCPSLMGRDGLPRPVRKSPSTLEARYIRTLLHAGSGSVSVGAGRSAGSGVGRAAGSLAGSSRTPTAPRPLAEAALDRHPGQFQLGHHAGRELDARRTQLGVAHRARRRRDAEHRAPAPADDQVPPARSPTPDSTASVPSSTGRAVREELGAQDPTSWPDEPGLSELSASPRGAPLRIPTELRAGADLAPGLRHMT